MAASPVADAAIARGRALAAATTLLAIDPAGLGGMVMRARPGPEREACVEFLQAMLPEGSRLGRVPVNITDDRLLGGLDFAASLRHGRPILQSGLLTELDGGFATISMAERLGVGLAQRLANVLDAGVVRIEREGFSEIRPARVALILWDEGIDPDEQIPNVLRDRMAFWLSGEAPAPALPLPDPPGRELVARARQRLSDIGVESTVLGALVATAIAFGVDDIRPTLMALRAARALAALDDADSVDEDHLRLAAELVLAPRATRVPGEPPVDSTPESVGESRDASSDERRQERPDVADADSSAAAEEKAESDEAQPPDREPEEGGADGLQERLIEATRAALPAALLAALLADRALRPRVDGGGGRVGAPRESLLRGRPLTSRPGLPRAGARLDLLASLRAAAPWQRIRGGGPLAGGIRVTADDLKVRRFSERGRSITVFVIDASGSSALNRFAESKGAVELLLADCYVRRDEVAVVTFRGASAAVAVPPTRSLLRVKKCLAGLPGGGGTPLAAGLQSALGLGLGALRRGLTPSLVVLSDGNANVNLAGIGGRASGEADALGIASRIALAGLPVLFIDTAPRPRETAAALAARMRARYLPLPFASAAAVYSAVTRQAGLEPR